MQHFYNVSSTLIRQQPSDQTHVFFLNHFLRWSSYFWLLQPQLPCLRDYLADSYLSIYPSIHPSIYLSISPVYLTVYLAIDPSTYQSINLSIYLSLSLQDPPNRGVGGTRALAHFIYIYRYWHYWHTHEIPMEFHGIHPLSIAKPFCSGMEMEKSWITAGSNP